MTRNTFDRLTRLAAVDVPSLDRDATLTVLADVAAARGVLDHLEAQLAGHLASLSPTSELDHARAVRASTGTASRSLQRHRVGDWGAAGAALVALLAEGDTSAAHLDRYATARSSLPPAARHQFDGTHEIGHWAATLTPDQFARRIRQLADVLRREHGIDCAAQQRSSVRLRTWSDHATGLRHWSLVLDAERSFTLMADLEAALPRLAGNPPEGCPDDALERQAFLRAHALLSLLQHGEHCPGGGYRRELMVVVDTTRTTPRGEPIVSWGHGVEPPLEVLLGFAAAAQHVTIVDLVRGAVITRPERLDLGRSSRLASRLQRRALQALHPVCGVDGCDTPFDRCHLHHLVSWNDGGPTDLGNLVPLCSHHHHQAHEQRWHLHLDEHRRLRITLPDGRTLLRAPPGVQAA